MQANKSIFVETYADIISNNNICSWITIDVVEKEKIDTSLFDQLDILRSSFTKTTFINVVFKDTSFEHVIFDNCRFIGCTFEDLTVIRTKFKKCTFENTSFASCVLKSISFIDCAPSSPILEKSNTRFSVVTIPDSNKWGDEQKVTAKPHTSSTEESSILSTGDSCITENNDYEDLYNVWQYGFSENEDYILEKPKKEEIKTTHHSSMFYTKGI